MALQVHSKSPNKLATMRPPMNLGAQVRLSSRTAIFVACGLILAWLVLSRSLAAFLADTQPGAALWLDSRQPDALISLADQALTPSGATQAASTGSEQATEEGQD